MTNKQNLIPLTKRPLSEHREIASRGAKKTNEIKKAKKTLKENIEVALEYMKANKLHELTDENMKKFLSDTDVLTFLKCEMVNKTRDDNIRLKTIESLEDRIHGKVKQELETKNDTNITIKWEE